MIQSLTSSHSRDKKLLAAEAQQMLADSRAKIEFLKMRIMKAKQSKQQMTSANGDVTNNNNNKGTSGDQFQIGLEICIFQKVDL